MAEPVRVAVPAALLVAAAIAAAGTLAGVGVRSARAAGLPGSAGATRNTTGAATARA